MTPGERDPAHTWPLGDKVKAAREALGIGIREAARRAGFSPTTWTTVETGLRKKASGRREPNRPHSTNIIAAATVVGIDVDEALEMAGYDAWALNNQARPRPSVPQADLAEKMARLTTKQKAAIHFIIDAMLTPGGASGIEEDRT